MFKCVRVCKYHSRSNELIEYITEIFVVFRVCEWVLCGNASILIKLLTLSKMTITIFPFCTRTQPVWKVLLRESSSLRRKKNLLFYLRGRKSTGRIQKEKATQILHRTRIGENFYFRNQNLLWFGNGRQTQSKMSKKKITLIPIHSHTHTGDNIHTLDIYTHSLAHTSENLWESAH